MPKKRFSVERIINHLREAEVLLARGQTVGEVCRHIGVSEQLRDELLNGEIFYTLKEANVLIQRWRRHYNQVRPHSALGYKPPAPVTWSPGRPDPASATWRLQPYRPFSLAVSGLT